MKQRMTKNQLVKIIYGLFIFWLIVGFVVEFKRIWWAAQEWDKLASIGGLAAGLMFMLVCGLFVLFSFVFIFASNLYKRVGEKLQRIGWLHWLLVPVLSVFPSWFILFSPWGFVFVGFYSRLLLFSATVAATAIVLQRNSKQRIFNCLLTACLLIGSVFIFASELSRVTDYPFGLHWSEGNRFWDYSVLYGQDLYEYPADQHIFALIDRVRQSLWGIPFLFNNVSILEMRLWNMIVLTIPYALLGWMVFSSQKKSMKIWIGTGLWTLLFLNQGPIYTPLILSAILVAGAIGRPWWLALPLIGLAGYYAQSSRFTWLLAPAIWAGVSVFVGADLDDQKEKWRGWLKAALYGGAGIIGGYLLPITISALRSQIISTSMLSADALQVKISDQPLLWSRLWPNPTYGPGIILGLVFAIGPLIGLLFYLVINQKWLQNIWKKIAVTVSMLAFLVVGIIVSVKIGGGSNLHNMDMFLIGLVFIAALAWERTNKELISENIQLPFIARALVLLLVAVPAFQPMLNVNPLELPPGDVVESVLNTIRDEVTKAQQQGEVLFIDQRQLLTFGYVENIPLVPEYEKKLLMDKALSGDNMYFSGLYEDLAAQRFSLIISEPLKIQAMGEDFSFGEENDAWVLWVSEPILCFYEPIFTWKELEVQLLSARVEISECEISFSE